MNVGLLLGITNAPQRGQKQKGSGTPLKIQKKVTASFTRKFNMRKNTEAKLLLDMFLQEYERWEDLQTRRKAYMPPNYEQLGDKMFQAYKTAKQYGY